MVGAGAPVFAVMSYVISHQKMDKTSGFEVELNTKLLETMIGEPEAVIQKAVDYLCSPDQKTTTDGDEGRRLVRIGAFTYRVVNGLHYHNIKNAEDLREKNRDRQARYRLAHPDKAKKTVRRGHYGDHPEDAARLKSDAVQARAEDRLDQGESDEDGGE